DVPRVFWICFRLGPRSSMTAHTADNFRAKIYDVFVSYKHLDAEVRDILIEALEAEHLTVWWDAKLATGAFRPQLSDRINTCKLGVALWSGQVAAAPDETRVGVSPALGLPRLIVSPS